MPRAMSCLWILANKSALRPSMRIETFTCFFLKDYQEIRRYMRAIGYGSKGKAENVEKQVAREL
jgi:hypothetical protein